ncbi:hypothetical protein LINPERPRIM_LOCUS38564 [Linum perenne]
MSLLSAFVEGC